ncbi:Hypothetical protein CINCED_3A015543 [Cinara cedri]|nr:Hypothetical protein CINCED_3A015543 [Cinara cedri]
MLEEVKIELDNNDIFRDDGDDEHVRRKTRRGTKRYGYVRYGRRDDDADETCCSGDGVRACVRSCKVWENRAKRRRNFMQKTTDETTARAEDAVQRRPRQVFGSREPVSGCERARERPPPPPPLPDEGRPARERR